MGSHKPGKCKQCGGRTGSVGVVQCRQCYNSRGREWGSQRHGAAAEGLTVKGDTAELVTTVDTPIKTLKDLIRVCEIDTNEWDIISWVANKWETAAKDQATQKIVTRPLFQVKATMKRKVDVCRARVEIQALIEDAKKQIEPRPAPRMSKPKGDHMLEIAIFDAHIGKLSWGDETLGSNYDHKIAIATYREAVTSLVQRTSAFNFSRILLPIGNDLFHSDTKAGTTTSGTPLDNDSRYHKTFREGRKLLVETVERLRAIAPVTVVIVPGNHDSLGAYHVGDSLECWYHDTPDVEILNSPSPRKYVQHGKVMLLFTHGDKGKQDNYPLLMATEKPEMFGSTVHREVHCGHLHQLRLKEHMGVRVRVSSSISAADAWHSENHFKGNKRAAEAFVWHQEEGLIAQATYTVPED